MRAGKVNAEYVSAIICQNLPIAATLCASEPITTERDGVEVIAILAVSTSNSTSRNIFVNCSLMFPVPLLDLYNCLLECERVRKIYQRHGGEMD